MVKSYFYFVSLLFIVCISISSCKDSASRPEPAGIKITSISPQSGVPGDEVTISGTGFEKETTSLKVLFNGVQATVTSINETQVKAEVPEEAITGSIQVVMGTQVAEGPEFSVLTNGALEVVITTSGDDQDRDGYILVSCHV